MSGVKKLFGQTAIYGLNTLARFLNYLLVPLHTSVFTPDQYGIISELYAYVAFLVVLLTYGMETTYFRLASDPKYSEKKSFGTIFLMVSATSSLFIVLSYLFSQPIATALKYPNNSEFIIWLSIIVSVDAISSIPLVKLRRENKLWQFNLINIFTILINILFNVFFLMYVVPGHQAGKSNWFIETFYDADWGVSYVFIANLVASLLKFLILSILNVKKIYFDLHIFKKAIHYGLPLLIVGLAGMVNETIDRILLKSMLYNSYGELKTQTIVGIYGACYKLSIIITLFVQAFRYAAEPFFFSIKSEHNKEDVFVQIMNFFVIFCAFIFLTVMLFIDYAKMFIPNKEYWEGLKIVPILLYANIFLGIYYNLSSWYKLTDKTKQGAYIAIMGAIITIVLNIILIPHFTYVGAAWTTFICYFLMMMVSYFMGQKHFFIPYNKRKILLYLIVPYVLYMVKIGYITYFSNSGTIFVNVILLSSFLLMVIKTEKITLNEILKKKNNPMV